VMHRLILIVSALAFLASWAVLGRAQAQSDTAIYLLLVARPANTSERLNGSWWTSGGNYFFDTTAGTLTTFIGRLRRVEPLMIIGETIDSVIFQTGGIPVTATFLDENTIELTQQQDPTPIRLMRSGACDPYYPTVCIPPPPPDLDCDDISFRNFSVIEGEPHNFDTDHDGIGCESE
jgi:hypothetical protein